MNHFREIKNLDNILSSYCENANTRKVGFGLFGMKNCFLLKSYNNLYKPIEELEVRNDDVWLIGFPRTGTTWLQEMVWLIQNDCNFEKARTNLSERFPWLENSMHLPGDSTSSIEIVNQMKSPRLIKTHLPFNLLPIQIRTKQKQPKILYIARNPLDSCVSLYHFINSSVGFNGSLDDLVFRFTNDEVMYGPFWNHVQEFWKQRNETNILFLTYESIKKDLQSVIVEISNFVNKEVSSESMKKLVQHLSFESMKTNPALNLESFQKAMSKLYKRENYVDFIRKGEVGGWKDEFSEDSKLTMDEWVQRNKIAGIWDNII